MINVNELMVGDWVRIIAHYDIKAQNVVVSSIPDEHEDFKGSHGHYGHICAWFKTEDDEICDDIEETKLEPIALNFILLEYNGFKPTTIDGVAVHLLAVNDGTVQVSEHSYGLYLRISLPYHMYAGVCNTVHEFQNALRVCGLTNEANNFKA